MSDVNETLGAAGAGELVESGDRVWSFAHVGPGIRAKFSAWCKLRARRELLALKPDLGEADYREQLAVLNAEVAAGSYNWGTPLNPKGLGPAVQAILNGEEGQLHFLTLLLEPRHGRVAPADVVALVTGNPEGVRQAVRACLGLPAEAGGEAEASADPNAPAPAVQTTPGKNAA
jgi:hypothetical protein